MSGGARLPLIEVAGTAFERGAGLGAQLGARIRTFLAEDMARINRVRAQPLAREAALRYVARVAPIVEAEVPEIAQAVRGLAAGASIAYADAMLLQFRRELISAADDDCTTVAGFNENGAFVAQNVDLAGDLEDLGIVVRERPSEPGEPDVLMFTHVGLLGYLGLNSAGLAVGINMVLSERLAPRRGALPAGAPAPAPDHAGRRAGRDRARAARLVALLPDHRRHARSSTSR